VDFFNHKKSSPSTKKEGQAVSYDFNRTESVGLEINLTRTGT